MLFRKGRCFIDGCQYVIAETLTIVMLPEHKNPIFVSKRPKISEKSPILTQKPRFCARKAGKWGSRSQKAHKNADFVLGGPHRTARSSSEEHGTSKERPGAAGNNHPKRNKTAWNEAQRPEAQRNATATQRNVTEAQGNTRNLTHATQPTRHGTMGNNKKGDNLSGCLL